MEYRLIRTGRKTLALEIQENGTLVVRAPMFISKQRIEAIIESKVNWIEKSRNKLREKEKPMLLTFEEAKKLQKLAKESFLPRLQYFSQRFDLPFKKLTITSARTCFGSCSPKNNISLSYFLASYPQEAIDYVMLHELCHTKEHNHSKAFYNLLEKNMPDWKERKKLLSHPMPEVFSKN